MRPNSAGGRLRRQIDPNNLSLWLPLTFTAKPNGCRSPTWWSRRRTAHLRLRFWFMFLWHSRSTFSQSLVASCYLLYNNLSRTAATIVNRSRQPLNQITIVQLTLFGIEHVQRKRWIKTP